MPQVDFYLLSSASEAERMRFACRLGEKAWLLGHRVYVLTGDDQGARRMDELLWTFRQDSFLPHVLATSGAEDEPVLIGTGACRPREPDVVINVADASPDWLRECARLAEVVTDDPGARAAARERYRAYRELGYAVDHHSL